MIEKKVRVLASFSNEANGTFSIVFDTPDLDLVIAESDNIADYPAGSFFITMQDSAELRFAVIPKKASDPSDPETARRRTNVV